MDRFFNMDNKFFTFMSRVADLMILNLITIACCVPIVTIGPALTALFYMTMKMMRNEESYIVRGYFKSFKENLKQGIIINLIMLAAGLLLFMDFRIAQGMEGNMSRVMYFLLAFILLIYLMIFVYVYPVLAKFYNTIRNTFVNAFLMSVRHLPYTLLMILVTVLPFVLFFTGSAQIQSIELGLSMLLGISGIAFINSWFLVRIFDNYIPKESAEEEDSLTLHNGEDI